jgi:hypothetical protein
MRYSYLLCQRIIQTVYDLWKGSIHEIYAIQNLRMSESDPPPLIYHTLLVVYTSLQYQCTRLKRILRYNISVHV